LPDLVEILYTISELLQLEDMFTTAVLTFNFDLDLDLSKVHTDIWRNICANVIKTGLLQGRIWGACARPFESEENCSTI